MPAFRCYLLDANDHIRAAEVIDAKALGDAIEKGLAMLRQSRFEGARNLGRCDEGVSG